MLKSCKYCGRIHDSKFDCGRKPKSKYKRKESEQIRYTTPMKRKSVEIKESANYLCEVCRDKGKFVTSGLETHHIEKLVDRPDLALDNNNLICLCRNCHEQAEKGYIDVSYLRELARKREEKAR